MSSKSGQGPRKFSEKIALLKQKEAESTASFEDVMRDVQGVSISQSVPTPGSFSMASVSAGGALPTATFATSPPSNNLSSPSMPPSSFSSSSLSSSNSPPLPQPLSIIVTSSANNGPPHQMIQTGDYYGNVMTSQCGTNQPLLLGSVNPHPPISNGLTLTTNCLPNLESAPLHTQMQSSLQNTASVSMQSHLPHSTISHHHQQKSPQVVTFSNQNSPNRSSPGGPSPSQLSTSLFQHQPHQYQHHPLSHRLSDNTQQHSSNLCPPGVVSLVSYKTASLPNVCQVGCQGASGAMTSPGQKGSKHQHPHRNNSSIDLKSALYNLERIKSGKEVLVDHLRNRIQKHQSQHTVSPISSSTTLAAPVTSPGATVDDQRFQRSRVDQFHHGQPYPSPFLSPSVARIGSPQHRLSPMDPGQTDTWRRVHSDSAIQNTLIDQQFASSNHSNHASPHMVQQSSVDYINHYTHSPISMSDCPSTLNGQNSLPDILAAQYSDPYQDPNRRSGGPTRRRVKPSERQNMHNYVITQQQHNLGNQNPTSPLTSVQQQLECFKMADLPSPIPSQSSTTQQIYSPSSHIHSPAASPNQQVASPMVHQHHPSAPSAPQPMITDQSFGMTSQHSINQGPCSTMNQQYNRPFYSSQQRPIQPLDAQDLNLPIPEDAIMFDDFSDPMKIPDIVLTEPDCERRDSFTLTNEVLASLANNNSSGHHSTSTSQLFDSVDIPLLDFSDADLQILTDPALLDYVTDDVTEKELLQEQF